MAGLPKAALVTHERVMQASLMFSLSNVRENDVLYLYLPLYHSSGFMMGLCGAMETGKGARWEHLFLFLFKRTCIPGS